MAERRHNAADVDQVRKQQQRAKDVGEIQAQDLKNLLTLPEFRRYIWRHLNETCGIMRSAASPNGSQQSLNIGMQDVGRALWAEIEALDPLVIPKLMTEYFEAQK